MMSLHKLTAGSGYDYLTRQVAAQDSTTKGHTTLADYYEQKGESPGRWLGSGLVGIDGLEAGDQVTADQMLSLFGIGDHPLARDLATALAPYMAGGTYGAFFEGAATLDLSCDFTVFEMSDLAAREDLRSVVLSAIMFMTSQAMTRSPRSVRKLLLIDEAWALLKGVVLSTLLGVGSELQFSGESDLVQAVRQSTQQSVSRAGDQLTSRNLQVQPTITIRPGAPVRLLVHHDLILKPWME